MIIDAHCHAWRRWPYTPTVPDPEHRSSIDQLRHVMAEHDVERALVVCAEISAEVDNNAYVAEGAAQHRGQLYQLAELDSHWKPTYHTPGATDRLQAMLDRWPLVGFTHYMHDDDDGTWLHSPDGAALLELAASQCPIASLHCKPHQMTAVRRAAQLFPKVTFLIHHMGHPQVGSTADLNAVTELSALDNVHLKLSGFYYGTKQPLWDFPLADMQPIVEAIYRAFGSQRLHWGSDFPVCLKKGITYVQSLEILRYHCRFIPAPALDQIMGQALYQLLEQSPA